MVNRRLWIGLLMVAFAIGAVVSISARADVYSPQSPEATNAITTDFKEELIDAARGLKDDIADFRKDIREKLEGKMDPETGSKLCRLWGTKYWIIDAEKEMDYYLDHLDELQTNVIQSIQSKLQSAQKCKQTAYKGLESVIDSKEDIEKAIEELIVLIQSEILTDGIGRIGQSVAKHLVNDILLPIYASLSSKDEDLIEIDIKLEKVDEYLIAAEASLQAIKDLNKTGDEIKDQAKQAKDNISKAWRMIEKAIKDVWELKENLKWIRSYLCGFVQEVARAPILKEAPPSRCPWCVIPEAVGLAVTELRTYNAPNTVHFAVLGRGVEALRVQVFNLAGRVVFDPGFVAGNALSWDTHTVANGVYLYVATVRGYNGEVIRTEVRKLAVVR